MKTIPFRTGMIASALLTAGLLVTGAPRLDAQSALPEPSFTPSLTGIDDASAPTPPKSVGSLDLGAIDKAADPCTDFYQYACGNWIKDNPVPGDQVRWARSFSMLGERNRYLLWQELDAAAKDPKTPLQKKYGDFFAACMSTDLVEKKGLTPLDPAFHLIASFDDPKHLATLVGALQKAGDPAPLFGFSVSQDEKDSSKQIAETRQGGLSLPDREYYISDSKRFATIRQQYLEHITKMFTLAGDSPEKASKEAADVLRIETALAHGALSRTALRDPENRYHIYTIAELEKLTPDFDWPVYWRDIGIGHFDTLNVATPDFFKALDQLISTEPTGAWQSYLR